MEVSREPPSEPDPTPVHWTSDANQLRLERQLDIAKRTLATEPYNSAALRDAVEALDGLKRWSEAADLLERLCALEPESVAARFRLAGALMRSQRWGSAADALDTVVKLDPQRVDAWHNLAVCRQVLGRLAAARNAWDQVIALRPTDIDAHAHRAEVSADLGDWEAAATDFAAAAALAPDDLDLVLNQALALRHLGRLVEARELAASVVKARPRHTPALNLLAALSWSLYQRDPARDDLQQAAISAWRRSLAVASDQPDISARLAEALGTE